MRLYIDEDASHGSLLRQLRAAGHDLQAPSAVGLLGECDARQLRHAIAQQRVMLSYNDRDFRELHYLVVESGGHHAGIIVMRRDNDPRKDLSLRGITNALSKLEHSGLPMLDTLHVLNQWR